MPSSGEACDPNAMSHMRSEPGSRHGPGNAAAIRMELYSLVVGGDFENRIDKQI
jgi:hypothetical protein